MLAVEPSFVMYRRNAELFGMQYESVPLNADFSLNLPAVLQAIQEKQPAITFIAYPNNPTGKPFLREEIEQIVQAASGIVVIDEAYGAFADDTFYATSRYACQFNRAAYIEQNRFCRFAFGLRGWQSVNHQRVGKNFATLQHEPS